MTPEKERLGTHLLQRGVATLGGRMFVMSAVHTEEDVDKTVNALEASLVAMREEGTL
jgi:glutamate-1-semialdehyde aminotransferase